MQNRSRLGLISLSALLVASLAFAEPLKLPFSRQTHLPEGAVTLRFSLWDAKIQGSEKWFETKDLEIEADQRIVTQLGDVTDASERAGPLSEVNFSEVLWVQVDRVQDGSTQTLGERTLLTGSAGPTLGTASEAKTVKSGTQVSSVPDPGDHAPSAGTKINKVAGVNPGKTLSGETPATYRRSAEEGSAVGVFSTPSLTSSQSSQVSLQGKVAAASIIDKIIRFFKNLFGGGGSGSSEDHSDPTDPSKCTTSTFMTESARSAGFFALAYLDNQIFAGTYNDSKANYIQVKALAGTQVSDWNSGTDPAGTESFYRFGKVGSSIIAVSESTKNTAGIFAWQAGSKTWKKLYQFDNPARGITRAIALKDNKLYVSAVEMAGGPLVRTFSQSAVEAAAGEAAAALSLQSTGEFADPLTTIGFTEYKGKTYAYGNYGLGVLEGNSISSVCSGGDAGFWYKNAIVWKDALWIAGRDNARGRPAIYRYKAGGSCEFVMALTDAQMTSRDFVKLWGLATKGDEIFVSTLCFGTDCSEPTSNQAKTAIFKCYDKSSDAKDCGATNSTKWEKFMTFADRGIKEMLWNDKDLYVATNNAKLNIGGSVFKISCPVEK